MADSFIPVSSEDPEENMQTAGGDGSRNAPSTQLDLSELFNLAPNDELKIAIQFAQAIQNASLEDKGMELDPEVLERLRNPPQEPFTIGDPNLRLALNLFLAVSNCSQETYHSVRHAILRRYPEDDIPTLDQIKRRIVQISGVTPLKYDMCINSCLAYTGPFREYDICSTCSEPWYDPVKSMASGGQVRMPRQEFHTMPVGPQLQALWRDRASAERMKYRDLRTKEILDELQRNHGCLDVYDDFLCGKDCLEAVSDGRIKPSDPVLMFSIDGAQLYQSKASDCWIGIWLVFDHDPTLCYKKGQVLYSIIIPGPRKPKNMESFLFPGFHHLSAIQKEGLRIWDASRDEVFVSHPFLALGTADGPGMAMINGLVGHHGK
jgi:hypothetical protein